MKRMRATVHSVAQSDTTERLNTHAQGTKTLEGTVKSKIRKTVNPMPPHTVKHALAPFLPISTSALEIQD